MLRLLIGFPIMVLTAIVLAKIINPILEKLDDCDISDEIRQKGGVSK